MDISALKSVPTKLSDHTSLDTNKQYGYKFLYSVYSFSDSSSMLFLSLIAPVKQIADEAQIPETPGWYHHKAFKKIFSLALFRRTQNFGKLGLLYFNVYFGIFDRNC